MRATFVITLVVAFLATCVTANASISDPRKCWFNRPADCARTAAKTAVLNYMRRTSGRAGWDAQITCAARGSLLRWGCTWKNAAGTGADNVRFWATSTGWHVRVTVL